MTSPHKRSEIGLSRWIYPEKVDPFELASCWSTYSRENSSWNVEKRTVIILTPPRGEIINVSLVLFENRQKNNDPSLQKRMQKKKNNKIFNDEMNFNVFSRF